MSTNGRFAADLLGFLMADLRTARRATNREQILLELQRQGPLQRVALSERLQLRANSVGSICGELLKWGLVREVAGPPANQLQLHESRPFFVAGYIGAKGTTVARVQMNGDVAITSRSVGHAGDSPAGTLNVLIERMREAIGPDDPFLCGVGLSMPAHIDAKTGVVRHAVNLPGWHDIDASLPLRQAFGRLTLIENEVRCHLWEDLWFQRRAEPTSTIIYLLIIEGVACAVLVHRELLQGKGAASGEIGHIPCDAQGRLCACGKHDCLEAYCSETAIIQEIQEYAPEVNSSEKLAEYITRLPQNARLAMLFDRTATRLATVLTPVLAALDPAELVLACRTRSLADALREPLRFRLRERLSGLPVFDLPVATTLASEETALRGVAGLLMKSYFAQIGQLSPTASGELPVMLAPHAPTTPFSMSNADH